MAENLNAFLASQNSLFRSGAQPEYPALEACIDALGALGDGSSFSVLFSAYVAGYSPSLAAKAANALGSIKGRLPGLPAPRDSQEPAPREDGRLRRRHRQPQFRRRRSRRVGGGRDGRRPGGERPIGLLLPGGGPGAPRAQALHRSAAAQPQVAEGLAPRDLALQARPGRLRQGRRLQVRFPGGHRLPSGPWALPRRRRPSPSTCSSSTPRPSRARPSTRTCCWPPSTPSGSSATRRPSITLLQIGYLQYTEAVKRAAKDALLKLRW